MSPKFIHTYCVFSHDGPAPDDILIHSLRHACEGSSVVITISLASPDCWTKIRFGVVVRGSQTKAGSSLPVTTTRWLVVCFWPPN